MAIATSEAEKFATAATTLESFPINFEEVKRTIKDILAFFGREHIFAEYTKHDISHIDDMLSVLDWLIPSATKPIMSPGDWLMLVMAIYFHDMGLIVTRQEFESRGNSGFPAYCERILSGLPGADYQAKLGLLDWEQQQRFLYQEFVRENHGRRVRSWIEGKISYELGYAEQQIKEINNILSGLDSDFRKDLALVCESHNLDDIENTDKYHLDKPYGNSNDETVNIQFCAIMLRTVDLIQITRRRAPSVEFRLINPSDPISQEEWAKQNAVKRVRPKTATDKDGQATTLIQSDTIEVYATFSNDAGFFGLTSYIRYAADQIAKSHAIISKSKRRTSRNYSFPWRFIDDDNIQVDGYIKRTFGFEIDQEKVLNLLIGHTLYNDSAVVLRELTQNAIDAVRLQALTQELSSDDVGSIEIT